MEVDNIDNSDETDKVNEINFEEDMETHRQLIRRTVEEADRLKKPLSTVREDSPILSISE